MISHVRASTYEATLPIFDQDRELGEVKVVIEDEKVISLDKASLLKALSPHIAEDTHRQFEKLPETIDPRQLPLSLRFNPQDFKLEMPLALKNRSTDQLNLLDEYQQRYAGEALAPSPFGGAINYRMEQFYGSTLEGKNEYFSTQFDSFLNIKSLVLESQTFYQSNEEKKWFRGDTRLVKDFEKKQIRVQAGDVYPFIQGFMSPRPMGGISISRNFALNPYRLPYPTGSQNFSLNARSFVKYFVNGTLIRSEYLPAGNYNAKDIPLSNGLNTIMIEATDDLGQKKVFVFRSAASINLLNEGESRFDLSHGVPFTDANFQRNYLYQDGKVASGFYQYGFSSVLSGSVYGQNQANHNLLGTELIQATTIGNLGAGLAQSKTSDLDGSAGALTYQLIGEGGQSFLSQTLGLRYEHRGTGFRTGPLDVAASVKNNYSLNYTKPLASVLTASLGGNFGDVRDNGLNDRFGFDTTLNLRFLTRHNLSLFVGRNRDEFKNWNDVAYLFVTITFPDSNDFLSTFYDQQQKTTKLTYIRDNQNRLYKPKAQGIIENNNDLQSGEVDLLFPTPFAELGGRIHSDHVIRRDAMISRGSLRMNSAFVFAYQDGDLGLGLSRPINNSFVLFKPEPRLKNQHLALKSTSPYTEAESGIFKEITFSNLLPYQYREVQLDPTFLDEGQSIQKEKFVLYPTYRSAHLIKLLARGAVMLKGTLKDKKGSPRALKVGRLGDKTFFTNRQGQFFIEGVEPGQYALKLTDAEAIAPIEIKQHETGHRDLGTLILPESE